jgi:titin
MRVISFDFGAKNPTPVSYVAFDNTGTVTWVDPTPATLVNGKPSNAGDKTNEIGFIVLRSDDGGATFPPLPTIIPQSAAQPGALPNVTLANATSWTDPTVALHPVTANTRYAVYGFNSTGYSTDVAAAIAAGQTSFAADPAAPNGSSAAAAVNNLGATLGAFDPAAVPTPIANTNQTVGGFPVTLTWSTASAPASYVLVRSGGLTQTGTALPDVTINVAGNALGYVDPAAAQSSTFTYRIKAVDAKGVATASTQAVISTPFATPPDVTGLVGSPVPGGWSMTWDALTVPYFTAYKITRLEIDPVSGQALPDTATVFVMSQFINPLSGVVTVPANSYVDTSLLSGKNYSYSVSAINGNVTSANASSTVVASGGGIAAAPGAYGLSASAATTGHVTLSWQAAAVNAGNVGRVATGYILTRTLNDPATGLPAAGAVPITLATPAGVATSFVDTTVADNTSYTYTLTWFNGSKANVGAYASVVVATPYAVPGTVSSLTAVAQLAALPVQVQLNWAAAKPATGYIVSRCEETALNGYCTNANTVWTPVTTLTAATLATSFLDTGVVSNSAYTYRVQAFNGPSTNVSAVQTVSVATSIPATSPATVTAVAALNQVTLTWDSTTESTSTTAFEVQRSTDPTFNTGVTKFNVSRVASAAQSMVDYGPFAGGFYYYRVFGVAVTRGVTNMAATASSVASVDFIAPNAPVLSQNLSFVGTSPVISWAAATVPAGGPAVSGYLIYRNGSQIASIGAVTSYTDTSATAGNSYSYQVVATNGVGNTVSATTVTANVLAQVAPTLSSAALNGTATTLATQAALSWTAPVANATRPPVTGYAVHNYGVALAAPLSATVTGTTATVTGLVSGTNYNFSVVDTNAAGSSADSAALPVTDVVQNAPTLATPTFLSPTQVQLNWTEAPNASTYAVKGYTLWQKLGAATTYSVVGTAGTATSGMTVTPAAVGANSTGSYYVTAYNDAGPSAASTAQTVNTAVPNTPTTPVAAAASATSVTLSLAGTVPANAPAITGYQFLQSLNGGAYTAVTPTAATLSSATFAVTAGNTYRFQAVAVNPVGNSATSGNSNTVNMVVPSTPTQNAVSGISATGATINWNALTQPNNAPLVTGYQIMASVNGGVATAITSTPVTATSATVALTAGNSYVFTVVAQNVVGNSTASGASAALYNTGLAMTSVTKGASTDTVNVNWTALNQAAIGGSNITGYRVEYSTDATFATGVTRLTVTPAAGASVSTALTNVAKTLPLNVRLRATTANGTNTTVTTIVVPVASL